jgi:protein SCO1/2
MVFYGPGLLVGLLLLFSAAFAAEPPANVAPAPAKDACCAALAAVPYSRESIYQLEGKFRTDEDREFSLGELRGRPVVLNMFFASCGYACPLQVTDMQALRAQLPAAIREQTVFVLVSFDTVRDTPAALAAYRTQRALDGQWRLLHGDDPAVRELAALLGVKYKQETDGMFAHSNIITLLNTEGEIVHQRIGLKGGLPEAAAALAAAIAGK